MGAWGNGPFDNDDAADFAGDLADMTDSAMVVTVLGDALLAATAGEGYIEAPEMARAVAAAAVVAIFVEATLPTPSSLEQSWLDSVRVSPSNLLKSEAAQVLTRAFQPENNEWHELWADAGLVDEVRATLAPYTSALDSESA
jgi:hypothetical protein